ncbi:MAG: peptidyl-prolyl cis-trans isomerase [Spirochaetaceae bacterium]|nr:MAG: peptidyl-prolyl cis-trans isomerase [Spirochaetaceae bacterium]
MASREIRRIKDRKTKTSTEGKKPLSKSFTSILSLAILGLVLVGLLYMGGTNSSIFNIGKVRLGQYDNRSITWEPGNFFAKMVGRYTSSSQANDIPVDQIFKQLMPYMYFHTALLIEAEKSGFNPGRKEIEEFLKTQGVVEEYNRATNIDRISLYNFYREIYIEYKITSQLIAELDYSRLIAEFDNKALDDFIAKMGEVEKKFRYVVWSYSDYPREEVVKYALENKAQFRTIQLSRLSTKNEKDARDALSKIRSGSSSFEEQGEVLKSDISEPMDQPYYRLLNVIGDKQAVDAIYSLKKGGVSDVVQVGSDWIIYRCEAESIDANLADVAVMDEIASYVTTYEKGKIEGYFETKAREFAEAAGSNGFASAAVTQGLKSWETGYFPLNIKGLSFLKTIPTPTDNAPSILSAQEDVVFFTQAFSLTGDKVSQPILLDDKIIVLQLSGERKAEPAELEKIKSSVTPVKLTELYQFFQMPNTNPALMDQSPYYSLIVDPAKMGTPAEQEEMFQRGFESFKTETRQQ